MRKKMQDTYSKRLDNGIMVRGSYRHSISACHVEVFVVTKDGMVVGSKHFTIKGNPSEPGEDMIEAINQVAFYLIKTKLDKTTSTKVLTQWVPYVMQHAFPKKAA